MPRKKTLGRHKREDNEMMRINGTGGEKRAELWKEFVVFATTWRAYTFGDGLLYAMIRSGRTPSWLRADWIQWSRCTLIYVMHYEKETMPSGASLVYDSLPGRHEKKNYRVVRCPCRYRFSNVKSREFLYFPRSLLPLPLSYFHVVTRIFAFQGPRKRERKGRDLSASSRNDVWVQRRRTDDSISLETVFFPFLSFHLFFLSTRCNDFEI